MASEMTFTGHLHENFGGGAQCCKLIHSPKGRGSRIYIGRLVDTESYPQSASFVDDLLVLVEISP
jgi:hypothetical protein